MKASGWLILLGLLGAGCASPPAPSGPDASALFAHHCASCHRLDGVKGGPGPDLSTIGRRRSAAEIQTKIVNPAAWRIADYPPLMPQNFSRLLKPDEIDALAAWLAAMGKK